MRNKKGIVSKLGIFIVLMTTVCMTGCVSLFVDSAVAKTFAPNKIFLHSNPKVGDFVKLEGSAQASQESNVRRGQEITSKSITEYEITEINGDKITVALTSHVDSSSNGILFKKTELDTGFKYVVDFDGNVQKAYYVNNKGKETELKILQPGMQGYFDFDYSSLPITKLKDKSGVETECYVYVQVSDVAKSLSEMGMNPARVNASGYIKTMYFISKNSDSVKFRLLGMVQGVYSTMDDTSAGYDADGDLAVYEGTQALGSKSEHWMIENGNKNEK